MPELREVSDMNPLEGEETLRRIDLFAPLNQEEFAAVLRRSRKRSLAPLEHLFHQGDPADWFFVALSGKIKLYRLSRDGHEKVMGLAEPGQTFAEGILFMERPVYPVDAQAVGACVIQAFARDDFLALLEHSFDVCRRLFAQMVQRTRRHLDEIEALTIQNARYRVVHYLLRHSSDANAGKGIVELPAAKSLIASQLAVQPETLSRLLKELERRGLTKNVGNRIEVPDLAALRDLLAHD